MTFWRFFTTRYTDHLEQENRDLKSQLAQERQEVRRLTEAAIPSLARANKYAASAAPLHPIEALKKPHHITKADDQQSASCTCGWKFKAMGSEEMVQLQTAISEHFKETFTPVKPKAVTGRDVISRLEKDSLEESKKQRGQA